MPHFDRGTDLASNRNEYYEGLQVGPPHHEADNLTAICERIVYSLDVPRA
jgi:hypothetical protein